MKALSLWQPWASFIAIGIKPFETRSWSPPAALIGQRIAIHAAKKAVSKEDREWARRCGVIGDLPLGAVVCIATLAGAYQCGVVNLGGAESIGRSAALARIEADEFGDYGTFRWAWWLTDIVLLDPPVQARGAQGLWNWSGS